MLGLKWRELAREIHESQSRYQCVLSATGGGSLAMSTLLTQPGASKTILEAVVPYSTSAFSNWIGKTPDSFCSTSTALAASARAWYSAHQMSPLETRSERGLPLGLGCTASLISTQPKRGDHRAHIAIHTLDFSSWYSIVLAKNKRSREEEEAIVAQVILTQLANVFSIEPPPVMDDITEADVISRAMQPALPSIKSLIKNQRDFLWVKANDFSEDQFAVDQPAYQPSYKYKYEQETGKPVEQSMPKGFLSGSFNPLHEGHYELKRAAEDILGASVGYELSLQNAEKPPLDYLTLKERCLQFVDEPVLLTTCPIFHQKAKILPESVFVVGVDTASRILNPRFYEDDESKRNASFDYLLERGCRFLVAARRFEGKVQVLSDLVVPKRFTSLFAPIPKHRFLQDISSTQLRMRS